ncbi:hypothetical protein M2132_001691 [Dysgonomonas sp. PH5-45]|uniref:DUF3329 domain-containing protein n=1 Tax=unclassified Dysgonomonas TaxID=2630389 RepID=UPI00247305DA|nr:MULTISPECIES: DUF6056 family protein [unclassified Dysgonomonas]MDH6355350.1 hypothetical protein [Dysgonomonas sp. PH5-45]MDH6388248.1 hypothetical protein [Dysgonomonas sp. PH5-37]
MTTIQTKIRDAAKRLDSFTDKPSVKKFNLAFIALCSFIFIYILNRLHPLYADDWMYSMTPAPLYEHISNFGQILQTQYEHYFTWGGRSVVHIIAQSLLLIGEGPADLLNSLAFVALTFVIYMLANKGKSANPSLLLGINLIVFLLQPAFGSTCLWITGSANYLWGTLIILAFLLPYKFYLNKGKEDSGVVLKSSFLFLFGIVAGWTNENMGVALVAIIALLLFYYKQSGRKIPVWAICGLVGVLIGCAFMIAAPGNFARMDMMEHTNKASRLAAYANQFLAALAAFYNYSLGLAFIFVLLLIVARIYISDKEKRKEATAVSLIFFFGAILAMLAMAASPIFPPRASFGLNMLIVTAAATLFAQLDFSKQIIKQVSICALAFGLFFWVGDYSKGRKELASAYTTLEKRAEFVRKEKQRGVSDIILSEPIYGPQTKYFHFFELQADSADWHNQIYSKYYSVNSVRMEW